MDDENDWSLWWLMATLSIRSLAFVEISLALMLAQWQKPLMVPAVEHVQWLIIHSFLPFFFCPYAVYWTDLIIIDVRKTQESTTSKHEFKVIQILFSLLSIQ